MEDLCFRIFVSFIEIFLFLLLICGYLVVLQLFSLLLDFLFSRFWLLFFFFLLFIFIEYGFDELFYKARIIKIVFQNYENVSKEGKHYFFFYVIAYLNSCKVWSNYKKLLYTLYKIQIILDEISMPTFWICLKIWDRLEYVWYYNFQFIQNRINTIKNCNYIDIFNTIQ